MARHPLRAIGPAFAAAAAVAACLVSGGTAAAQAALPDTPPPRATAPWARLVAGSQPEAERFATLDLQRYLAQVTGVVPILLGPDEWRAHPQPAVVLGTPQSNPLLAPLSLDAHRLGEQGYYLANRTLGSTRVVVAAGQEPEGAVHAVYGLLRELGYGFFLGSEAVPERLPNALPSDAVARRPAFAVRGVLPWYNFFNSPTVWDPVDHRALVDQLIRMGANFVGFHTYDHEPFAAYEEDGKMRWGGRLLSTQSPNWGTQPMPTRDFAFGTARCFAEDFFGAASTRIPGGPDAAIRVEQDVMRDALRYARGRGLRTCLGFEINGDPTRPADREVFLRRIHRLLDQYPSLDYLWIWQPESQGAVGFAEQHDPGSALEPYSRARRKTFQRIVERTAGERAFLQDNESGKAARAREGARLEQYAQLAHRALSRRAGGPRLVVSGWGGDERLLSAEYDDGLDKLLPSDVVFSSLDHISPRPRIDGVYHQLPHPRQRWPIPWLELDGDQWHPQPVVHVYESLARDARKSGSQGLLGIHWRTRDIEENLAFLVEFAWQDDLTADRFFDRYAARCYPPSIAPEMAKIHNELDRLGYRWVGGAGQVECGNFDWGPGTDENARKLRDLQGRLRPLLSRAGRSAERMRWLDRVMDWVLKFRAAEVSAVRARDLLNQGKPQEAWALLERDDLAQAVQAYAQRLTTRGEYGVLATLNTKAAVAWRELRGRCLAALGRAADAAPAADWRPAPQILLPRFLGSVEEHRDLDLMPVCLGGGPAFVHYRPLGQPLWTGGPMEPVAGWVQRARIPASALAGPGIEIGFSFHSDPKRPMAFGPVGVTVLPRASVEETPRTVLEGNASPLLELHAKSGQEIPVELTWSDLPEADYFKVYRDAQPVAETAVPFFPDAPTEPAPQHAYRVEAWRDRGMLAQASSVCPMADVALAEKADLALSARDTGVALTWPAFASSQVAAFRVRRQAADRAGREEGAVEARVPAVRTGRHRHVETLAPGRWLIEVVPLNQAGRTGPSSRIGLEWSPVTKTDTLELSLRRKPESARITEPVLFGESGAVFSGGYLEIPHSPLMDVEAGFRLAFEFRADDVRGMPVLMSHGSWQTEGWFVQILGGQLMIRTPHGDARGPAVEVGRWCAVRWEFDGERHRLAVDGREVMAAEPLRPAPAKRDLRLGQYADAQPGYAFRGTLRRVAFERTETSVRTWPVK